MEGFLRTLMVTLLFAGSCIAILMGSELDKQERLVGGKPVTGRLVMAAGAVGCLLMAFLAFLSFTEL